MKYRITLAIAAALALTACEDRSPTEPMGGEPVLIDDCPDGQPRKDGEPCK
jgi:hypothetical protein